MKIILYTTGSLVKMSREETNSPEKKSQDYNYKELIEKIIREFKLTGKKLMHPFFSCLLIQDPKNLDQLKEFQRALKAGSESAQINFFRQRRNPVSITDLIGRILSPDVTKSEHFPPADQQEIVIVLKTKVLEIDNDPNALHVLPRPCFVDTKDGSPSAVVAQNLLPDGTVVISIRNIRNANEKPISFIFTPAIDKNGKRIYLCMNSNSKNIDPKGITKEELLLLLNAGIVFVPSLEDNDPKNKIYLSSQSNPNQRRFRSNQFGDIPINHPDNPSLQAIKDSGLLEIQKPGYYIQIVKLLTKSGIVKDDAFDFFSNDLFSKQIFSQDAEETNLLEEYLYYLSDTGFTEFLEKIKGFFASSKYKILIDLGMTRILWQIYQRKKISLIDLSSVGNDETLSSEQRVESGDLQTELAKQQIVEAIIFLSRTSNPESSILMRTVLSNHPPDQLLKLLKFLIEKTGIPLSSSGDLLKTANYLISQIGIDTNRRQDQMSPSPIQVIVNPQQPSVSGHIAGTGLVAQQGEQAQISSTGTTQGSHQIVKKTPAEGIPLAVQNLITRLEYCVNNSLPFRPEPEEVSNLRFSTVNDIDEEFAKLKILSAFLTQNPHEAERLLFEIHRQIRDSGNRYFLRLALKATECIIDFEKNKIQNTGEIFSYYEKLIPKLQNYSPEKLYEIIVLAILDYGFWVSSQKIDRSLLSTIDKCIKEAHENLSQQATRQLSLVRRQTGGHKADPEVVREGRRRARFPEFKKEDLYRLASILGLISILYFGGKYANDQFLNPKITISVDGEGNVLPANSISSLQDYLASLFRGIFVQGKNEIEECEPPDQPTFKDVNNKPAQDLVNRTRDLKLIGEIDQEYGDKNFVDLKKENIYFVVVYNDEGKPVVVTSFFGVDAEIRRTEGMVLSKVLLLPKEIEDIFNTIGEPICNDPKYNNLLNQGGIKAIVVTVESARNSSRVSIMGNPRVRIPSLDALLETSERGSLIRRDVLFIEVPYQVNQ